MCVYIPMFFSSFYEWHGESKDTKQPYYVRFKDTAKPHQQKEGVEGKQLLMMAGLFDRQLSEEVKV